jgi:hypothetical protein
MTDTTPSTPLRDWLDQAWNDHPGAARRVADELAERAGTLPDDAVGADAVRLAEHVMLAHLADPQALRRFLAALPLGDALTASVQRARWALAQVDGLAAQGAPEVPEIPASDRWRALHSVVMLMVARGDIAGARSRLLAEEAAAAAHPDAAAQRGYAATANNTALDLRTGPRGDAARDALMIEAAMLSRRAWLAAGGNWMQAERADYQIAMCHAVLGQGAPAVTHAQACLAACEAHGAEPSERFFAHECCVHAHRADGDAVRAAQHRENMVALLEEISDAGMKQWCSSTLAHT